MNTCRKYLGISRNINHFKNQQIYSYECIDNVSNESSKHPHNK